MKKDRHFYEIVIIFSFIIASFSISFNYKKPVRETTAAAIIKEVNVCDIISQQDIEQIMNVKIDHTRNTLQNSDKKGYSFASQCSYYTKSEKNVGIMLRYFKNVDNPKTFDELVSINTQLMDPTDTNEVNLANDIKSSFLNGRKIENPGQVGVWYNWSDIPSLMLYFKNHYQMIVNLSGFGFTDDTLIRAKKIADKIVKNF